MDIIGSIMRIIKIFKLEIWEIFFLGLFLYILEKSKSYETQVYMFSILVGIGTGIITAIAILYIQRVSRNIKFYHYYRKIAGTYIRINMGQDNSNSGENESIKKQNINLEIILQYEDENKFSAEIKYWENRAKASATFEFNETNKMIGSGTYKYIEGEDFKDHFGSLDLYILENEPNRIYVKYQHVFPRELQNNPDNNRGWEIWEKKKSRLQMS